MNLSLLYSLQDDTAIVKHVDTQHKHTKRMIISHRTLRYFVEIMDNNYEIRFLCDLTGNYHIDVLINIKQTTPFTISPN